MDAIKPDTVNTCWRNLRSECANDIKGFPTTDNEVIPIVPVARQVECDGFVDILEKKYLGATKKY
jgi:hypothetical protein